MCRVALLTPLFALASSGYQRIFFQSNVYHPRVNNVTGELDLRNQYQEWQPRTDRLWHLLRYLKLTFYHIDAEDPVNEGAATL
jgi:ubiquitin-protein ligase